MDCLYCARRKGMERTYFNHANLVNVLCSGVKQMSDFDKFWKEEACGITFDYPHEGGEFAWNHQQQKIDAVLKLIDDKANAFCETHDMDKVALLEEIKELLK